MHAVQVMSEHLNKEKIHLSQLEEALESRDDPLDENFLQLCFLTYKCHLGVVGKGFVWTSHKSEQLASCAVLFGLTDATTGQNVWILLKLRNPVTVQFSPGEKEVKVVGFVDMQFIQTATANLMPPMEKLHPGFIKYIQWRHAEYDITLIKESGQTIGQKQVMFVEDLMEPNVDQRSFDDLDDADENTDIFVCDPPVKVEVQVEATASPKVSSPHLSSPSQLL